MASLHHSDISLLAYENTEILIQQPLHSPRHVPYCLASLREESFPQSASTHCTKSRPVRVFTSQDRSPKRKHSFNKVLLCERRSGTG